MKRKMRPSKRSKFKFILLLLACSMFLGLCIPGTTMPVQASKTTSSKSKTKKTVFKPTKSASKNRKELNRLMAGKKKKTIVIKKGSTCKISGALRPGSNTKIVATGAKIVVKSKGNVLCAAPNKKIKNLTIVGGKWRSSEKNGRKGTLFSFAFVDGLTMEGVDCNANYTGHAVEIIACSNVTVKNCNIAAIGTNVDGKMESQLQIDVATPKSAPNVAAYGAKYVKGQVCRNVYILNNTISGARAVGVNRDSSAEGTWKNSFHENIVIRGNKLEAVEAEALVYHNVIGGEISGNTVVTHATRTDKDLAYTIGIHVAMGGTPSAAMAGSTLNIFGNTVFGNRNGIFVKGYFEDGNLIAGFGTVNIYSNTVFCKNGADNAIDYTEGSGNINIYGNSERVW